MKFCLMLQSEERRRATENSQEIELCMKKKIERRIQNVATYEISN